MYVVVFDQVRFADAIVGGGCFEGEFADWESEFDDAVEVVECILEVMLGLVRVERLVEFGEVHGEMGDFLVVEKGLFGRSALVAEDAEKGFFVEWDGF